MRNPLSNPCSLFPLLFLSLTRRRRRRCRGPGPRAARPRRMTRARCSPPRGCGAACGRRRWGAASAP
eukprot:1176486-Prorocentrum_minimum.AAC.3